MPLVLAVLTCDVARRSTPRPYEEGAHEDAGVSGMVYRGWFEVAAKAKVGVDVFFRLEVKLLRYDAAMSTSVTRHAYTLRACLGHGAHARLRKEVEAEENDRRRQRHERMKHLRANEGAQLRAQRSPSRASSTRGVRLSAAHLQRVHQDGEREPAP